MLRVSLRNAAARRYLSNATGTVKRHPIRNFLFKSTLAVGTVYGGGLVLSEYNDNFADHFTAYVPLAEELVDTYEAYRYGHGVELTVPTFDSIKGQFNKMVYGSVDNNDFVIEEAVIPTQVLQLNLIELDPNGVEPEFYGLVKELNNTIEMIGKQGIMLSEAQIAYILECYNVLSAAVVDYNKNLKSNLKQVIDDRTKNVIANIKKDYAKKLQNKEAELTKKFLADFNRYKEELEKRTSEELAADLRANEQTLLAKHANQVALLSITQVEEFTKILREKLDSERNGRLGKLSDLDNSVGNLSTSLDKVNDLLVKKEATTQMILLLTQIKQKLFTAGTPDTGISIDKELKKLKTLTSILPSNSQSSCSCKSKCKANCKCKGCSTKKEPTLLDSTLNELLSKVSNKTLLSNEQLYNRWSLMENDFKTTSLLPQNPGILGHMSAKLFSYLLFTKRGVSPDGTDLDNLYAKVRENIRLSKLDTALADVVSLEGWPHVLCQDWIEDAKSKLEVEALIDVLDAEIRLL